MYSYTFIIFNGAVSGVLHYKVAIGRKYQIVLFLSLHFVNFKSTLCQLWKILSMIDWILRGKKSAVEDFSKYIPEFRRLSKVLTRELWVKYNVIPGYWWSLKGLNQITSWGKSIKVMESFFWHLCIEKVS